MKIRFEYLNDGGESGAEIAAAVAAANAQIVGTDGRDSLNTYDVHYDIEFPDETALRQFLIHAFPEYAPGGDDADDLDEIIADAIADGQFGAGHF